MKVLICGPLRDMSGYSHAARNMALALHRAGTDVALRHIKYDDYEYVPTSLEEEMFKKKARDCDIVLQYTTPNEIRYIPGKMNIAYLYWETTRIPSYWVQQLNLMDMILVPCRFNAMALQQSGVVKPVCICHPPFDMAPYNKTYKPLKNKMFEDRTIYYNICQMSAKKGVDVLLRSYFRAFVDIPDEPLLVLKSYINMVNRDNELDKIKQFVQSVKQSMRLPTQKYPPVLIISDIMDDQDIYRLHATGDVYVCSSRGEGWGIPPFEAMAFGKTLISHTFGGLGEFVHQNNSVLYPATQSLVMDYHHSDPVLYTAMEEWAEPNDHQLMIAMRRVHETIKGRGDQIEERKNQLSNLKSQGIQDTRKFDVAITGPMIMQELRKCYESWKENGFVSKDVLKTEEITNEVPKR